MYSTPLAKSVLIPLGLIAAASAIDAAIQKKVFGLGTKWILSWKQLSLSMKLVCWKRFLVEQFKFKQKNRKVDFSACEALGA